MSAAPLDQPTPDLDVVDMITELVDGRRHRERVTREANHHGTTVVSYHRVRVPGLIHQLDDTAPAGETAPGSAGFESRPAARLDAIDTLDTIDRGASRWLNRYDVDHQHLDTTDCVRRLGALMAGWDRAGSRCHRRRPLLDHDRRPVCCSWHEAAAEVRSWWARSRIVTGWDSPPWRPNASCPVCGMRGSLAVRLEERVATCVECHEAWDSTCYQEFADHVRVETIAAQLRGRPLPCLVVEGYEPASLRFLCKRCGRARCQRAVAEALEAVDQTGSA